MLKFRSNDLPEELICQGCKSVCQNPCHELYPKYELEICNVDTPYYLRLYQNQIQQFTQIQCKFCGEYQKYYHYRRHSNACQLIFEESKFLQKFNQIIFPQILCYKCNQIPFRPLINYKNELICLFCIQKQNYQNLKELSKEQQIQIDQIVCQCNSRYCQEIIQLNSTLNHYKKCQLQDSEVIKSEEYLRIISEDSDYQQFKHYYKQYNIGIKYQKRLYFNKMKLGYDLAKTILIQKQIRKRIKKLKKNIDSIYTEQL
ncbi:hypothetical protein pb186bvf_011212 [Paramecium bursaria]